MIKKTPPKQCTHSVAGVFLLWRFATCAVAAFSSLIPYREGFSYTSLWHITPPYPIWSLPFLSPWANFDGVHYLSIAANGYTDNMRFMPLYPLFIRIVTQIFTPAAAPFSLSYTLIAFTVSNIALYAALVILVKLLAYERFPKPLETVMVILVFPTSFFLGAIYAESLFLLLSVAAVYAARRRWWMLSGVAAGLAAATRIVGFSLVIVLLIEWFREKKNPVQAGLGVLFATVGALAYPLYNLLQWGNPLAFLQAHGLLANGRSTGSIVFPLQTLYRYAKIMFTTSPQVVEWWIAGLEVVSFALCCAGLYALWRSKMPRSYLVLAALTCAVPTLSGTFTGLPRYLLSAFPLFVACTPFLTKSRTAWYIYLTVSTFVAILLITLFARGYYIA